MNAGETGTVDKENGEGTPTLNKSLAKEGETGKQASAEQRSSSQSSQMKKWMSTAAEAAQLKALAEERKKALKEALAENEELHEEVEMMKTEVAVLRTERDQLQEQNEMLAAENQQLQRLIEAAAQQGFSLI